MSTRERKGKALIIDDSIILIELLSETLGEAGWEIATATSGEEGLRIARDFAPEVVVCDLHMPETDGLEVIRRMKEIDPNIPVVVLSADEDLSAVLGAVREGAFDYVLKADEDIRPLLAAVDRGAAHGRLAKENERLTGALQSTNAELQDKLLELDEKHAELKEEQLRSERLLLNILPRPIAEQLKDDHRSIAEAYPDVTVLFADIAGFTSFAAGKSPEEVVGLLNQVFSAFDHLAEGHGLEKIKTIGDAYMAACGLPEPNELHVRTALEAAFDMLETVKRIGEETGHDLQLRVGVHTGPVVAGVIGSRKFIYDLWGDTVNTASRMESQGQVGRIQVTRAVKERVGDCFAFEHRGCIEVRGKGEMDVWWVADRKVSPRSRPLDTLQA